MTPWLVVAVFVAPSGDGDEAFVFDGVDVEFSGAIVALKVRYATRTGFGDECIADFELRKIVVMPV